MKKKLLAFVAIIVATVTISACTLGNIYNPQNPPVGAIVFANAIQIEEGDSWPDIAEKLLPAAVSIVLTKGSSQYLGSGIAVAPGGIIATNYHVIQHMVADSGYTMKIYHDGDTENGYNGSLLWWSSSTDTAIVKCSSGDMPFAQIADRTVLHEAGNKLRVLEDVITIGTPLELGLQNTVTKGVVSQLNRFAYAEGRLYQDLIQHDSAISPGNSGGALIDSKGKVIGLNTLGRTDENASGLFYAVPITPIISVLPNIIDAVENNTQYLTPTLGVIGYDRYMDEDFSETGFYIENTAPTGSLINHVQIGDIIIAFEKDGITYNIDKRNDIPYTLLNFKMGDTLSVIVKRGTLVPSNETISFTITTHANS